MKQSPAKTLGVAVLGAAFAATAAGTASAAPASLPEAATSLDTVTSVLPVQESLTKLPAGAESLAGGQAALTQAAGTVPGTLQGAAHRVLSAEATEPVAALLGGLPAGDLAQGLPVGGLG
ncbi:ATP-binding protein [Streptomyces sp. NPDC051018]|uniref:ATP-binding protein n=1 Tax=Streptomyces sp. NPDC051018 TaxID=3365639 RepID=UPI0037B7C6F2